jgi:hypothetical protein
MNIIHFTERATDPLKGFDAAGARFLPLADGEGNSHISCLHLETNARIEAPSITHATALLVVHGCITVTTQFPKTKINIHAGSGCVLEKNEPYSLDSDSGAVILIVECHKLSAQTRAISSPQRIAGATWPSDPGRIRWRLTK